MSEPFDHAQRRPALESLLVRIPGFRGYLEKEYRRESDALQRQALADRIDRARPALDRLAVRLMEAAQLDQLTKVDRLRLGLDRLVGRFRLAMAGYSGFFDLVQVDEHLLDRVYDRDLDLGMEVDSLTEILGRLPDLPDADLQAEMAKVQKQIDRIEQAWNEREDLLEGVGR